MKYIIFKNDGKQLILKSKNDVLGLLKLKKIKESSDIFDADMNMFTKVGDIPFVKQHLKEVYELRDTNYYSELSGVNQGAMINDMALKESFNFDQIEIKKSKKPIQAFLICIIICGGLGYLAYRYLLPMLPVLDLTDVLNNY